MAGRTWQKREIGRLSTGWIRAGILIFLIGLATDGQVAFGQAAADPTMYSTYRPSVQRTHVDELIDLVIGDEYGSEALLANGLYEGYLSAWTQAANAARDELKMIRAEGRSKGADGYAQIQRDMKTRQQAFADEARALEKQYFADVQVALTSKQAGRWEKFQQARRRSLFLKRYRRLAGEDVDLIKLMKDLEFVLDDEIAGNVATLLGRYGDELDAALKARQAMMEDSKRRLEAIRSGNSKEDAERYYKSEVLPRHKALRDINDRSAAGLRQTLPEAEAKIFQAEFDHVRYPRIFALTQANRYLAKLEDLEDLSTKQESEIARLQAQYEIEIAPIIRRLMELQRERDEAIPSLYRLANLEGTGANRNSGEGVGLELATAAGGGSANIQLLEQERKLWQMRRDIEGRLIDAWFELLTKEQQEKAPKTPLVFQPGGAPTGPHDGGGEDDGG